MLLDAKGVRECAQGKQGGAAASRFGHFSDGYSTTDTCITRSTRLQVVCM